MYINLNGVGVVRGRVRGFEEPACRVRYHLECVLWIRIFGCITEEAGRLVVSGVIVYF